LTAGNGAMAALLIGGLALYWATMGLTLRWVERQVHSLVRKRGEEIPPLSWKTICAIPLAHLVYFACLASASVLAKVSWRGITYEFKGPWVVRMRKYRPYRTKKAADQGASVV